MTQDDIQEMVDRVLENSLGERFKHASTLIEGLKQNVDTLEHNVKCLKIDRIDLAIKGKAAAPRKARAKSYQKPRELRDLPTDARILAFELAKGVK